MTNEMNNKSKEIDIIETLDVLWVNKLIVAFFCLVFAGLATVYTYCAQESWTTSVKYAEPNSTANQELKDKLVKYRTVMGSSLDHYVDEYKMLNDFNRFASKYDVKKAFLLQNDSFIKYQASKKIRSNSIEEKKLIKLWTDNIKLIYPNIDKKGEFEFELKMTATSPEMSLGMLEGYTDFVSKLLYKELSFKIKDELKHQALLIKQSIDTKIHNAHFDMSITLEQYEVALAIASSAGIDNPIENFNINSQFRVDIGSKAIAAAIKELRKIDDVEILDPSIGVELYKYDLLTKNDFEMPSNVSFISVTASPELPHIKNGGTRAFWILLGTIFGGVIAVCFIFLREFISENVNKN